MLAEDGMSSPEQDTAVKSPHLILCERIRIVTIVRDRRRIERVEEGVRFVLLYASLRGGLEVGQVVVGRALVCSDRCHKE
jgi:hypothetical protein